MKTIDLNEILKQYYTTKDIDGNNTTGEAVWVEHAINAMREACNQCFELAAEEAKTTWEGSQIDGGVVINKQSILKLKERVK